MLLESFETERIILRKFTAETYKEIFSTLSVEEGQKITGISTPEEYQIEKEKSDGGYTTFRMKILHFRLFLKSTSECIGGCGFHNWFDFHQRAELGYHLFEPFRKAGYMTEATSFVLAYGFNEMKLHRVEALTAPYNFDSMNVLKKFGFVQEAILKEHYKVENTIEDSVLFRLLKREYELQLNS